MNKLILILAMLAFVTTAYSQKIIKGRAIDAVSRQPLEFANISLGNNETTHVLTDKDGYFSIKSDGRSDVLSATYIGYENTTSNIGNGGNVQIAMKPFPKSN